MTLPHLTAHEGHHLEFFIVLFLVIFMLYLPPKFVQRLGWLRDFIDEHFGDSIGLYILHLGIALIILAGVFPEMTAVNQIGQSLVLAAMGVLKLTRPANGNGNGHDAPPTPTPVEPK